jgi:hypothetical protein
MRDPGLRIPSNQPPFGRDGYSFGPPGCFQLFQNRLDMSFDRSFTDIEDRAYLFVASSIGDILQNLELTFW